MPLLYSPNRRRIASIIALLVGLIGVTHLVVGAWSLLTIYSLDIPGRASTLSSVIDSINPDLVTAGPLQTQVAALRTVAVDVLNFFLGYSGHVNVIPAYLILQGIIFLAIAIAIYFVFPKEEKRPTGS